MLLTIKGVRYRVGTWISQRWDFVPGMGYVVVLVSHGAELLNID